MCKTKMLELLEKVITDGVLNFNGIQCNLQGNEVLEKQTMCDITEPEGCITETKALLLNLLLKYISNLIL